MKLIEAQETNSYGRLLHKTKYPIVIFAMTLDYHAVPDTEIDEFGSPEEVEEVYDINLFNFKRGGSNLDTEDYINNVIFNITHHTISDYQPEIKVAVDTFNKHKSYPLKKGQQKYFIDMNTSEGDMVVCIICTPLEFKKLQKMAWDE
jgi:hypothetical protein